MPYVSTFNRNQMMFCSWDIFVEPESIARIIDAFVNSLDLTKYEVKEASREGRPLYDPKGMYKLYIYGNRKGIRSSRKLAESCKVNLEVKWMLGGVEPDFRTISDFLLLMGASFWRIIPRTATLLRISWMTELNG